jgi:hypothetical protein
LAVTPASAQREASARMAPVALLATLVEVLKVLVRSWGAAALMV